MKNFLKVLAAPDWKIWLCLLAEPSGFLSSETNDMRSDKCIPVQVSTNIQKHAHFILIITQKINTSNFYLRHKKDGGRQISVNGWYKTHISLFLFSNLLVFSLIPTNIGYPYNNSLATATALNIRWRNQMMSMTAITK